MKLEKYCDTCIHQYHDRHYCMDYYCLDHSQWESYTNADHLRQMSDEELGKWICNHHSCNDLCPGMDYCHDGHNGAIAWLKERVKIEE